ncbi:MAG: hypothetical protein ABSA76_01280 [Bacteroidales bacterium]
METEKALVKSAETRLPKFVEDAYDSVEKMERFAKILLDSKLVPNHFYEKLPDGKPDFTKGKTPAVVAVLIQGYQLQLPPLTALQHIIPVNGLLSIKGDLAKSMIFNSGKLKPSSWVEEETGSIENGDLVVKITATRSDNGQTLSRSFSVAQAKRAGLWITEQQVNGQDGWKFKSSAWWKYPARMINYRALGFLARDMFPDVMAGIYTTEEAMDLPKDTTEIIETPDGNKITIPDKEHSKARSEKMTERVADKIKDPGFGQVTQTIMQPTVKNVSNETVNVPDPPTEKELADAKAAEEKAKHPIPESPFIGERGSIEVMDGKEIRREPKEGELTLAVMEKMETSDLLKIINTDMDMMEALQILPGKNTNKKCREIILAHQEGRLGELLPKGEEAKASDILTRGSEIPVNKEFDKAPKELFPGEADVKEKISTNKYELTIPPFDKGDQRDFATTKQLFNLFLSISPKIDATHYLELAGKKGILAAFPDKETFCKNATIAMINELLDSN